MIERNTRKVAIDSNCFIYLMEGSHYAASLFDLFHRLELGTLTAVTSILTITEVLTGPHKSNDQRLIEEYRSTLLNFPNIKFRNMDQDVAERAAQIRVQSGLKTPDAIQLATAILEEAEVFITNNHDYKHVDFPILLL